MNFSRFRKQKAEHEKSSAYMSKCVLELTSANENLHRQIQIAWKNGYEAGKREVIKILEKIFTEKQVQALMTGQPVNWETEDVAGAIALAACSKKALRLVRDDMGIPLPSDRTIQRWTAKIKAQPGMQEKVLTILKKVGATLEEKERLVCLSFDEMSLCRRVHYDSSNDEVIGPHKHSQVVIMRPLYGTWKQPIYYNFDEDMTRDIFEKICKRLYEIGFIVVGAVCDLGLTNQEFLKEMDVFDSDKEDPKCSIPHPSDNNLKIFFFADAPHMLKLFRNHLIDTGFTLHGIRVLPSILATTIDLIKR
jgi:hypothetical protein